MIKSVLVPYKKFILFTLILITAFSYSFMVDTDWLTWSNKCFLQTYDPPATEKLKKWELQVTDDSFLRLRKTFANGKQEYFSLQLHMLDSIDYLGNANTGTLQLKTKDDDIIVQTYNDRKGNVDSMANILNIPLKNMEPERLDSLEKALDYFKGKAL